MWYLKCHYQSAFCLGEKSEASKSLPVFFKIRLKFTCFRTDSSGGLCLGLSTGCQILAQFLSGSASFWRLFSFWEGVVPQSGSLRGLLWALRIGLMTCSVFFTSSVYWMLTCSHSIFWWQSSLLLAGQLLAFVSAPFSIIPLVFEFSLFLSDGALQILFT